MTSWARVKYCMDGKVKEVPITFFQDSDIIEEELKEKKIRDNYQVFWSLKDSTPEAVLHRDGRIINIEEVEKSMVADPPVDGYYSATILNYASSQKDLYDQIRNRSGRRILKPNQPKAIEKSATSNKRQNNKVKATSQRAAREYNKQAFDPESSEVENKENTMTNGVSGSSTRSKGVSGSSTRSDGIDGNPKLKSPLCGSIIQENDKSSHDGSHLDKLSDVDKNPAQGITSKPKRASKSKAKENIQGMACSEDEEGSFTDGDGDEDDVPLAQHKEKIKEMAMMGEKIKSLQTSLEQANRIWEEKWQRAILEWKQKWDAAQNDIREVEHLKEENVSLLKKVEDLNQELVKYKKLNVWWQEQEMERKDRSRSHHSSRSKSHSKPSTPIRSPLSSPASIKSLPVTPKSFPNATSLQRFSLSETKSKKSLSQFFKPSGQIKISSPSESHASAIQKKSNRESPTKSTPLPNSFGKPTQLKVFLTSEERPNSPLLYLESESDVEDENNVKTEDTSRKRAASTGDVDESVLIQQEQADGSPTSVTDTSDESVAHGITVPEVAPISLEQFRFCCKTGMGPTKQGKAGDSMFCKNLIGVLLDKEELQRRSAAGFRSTTTGDEPRPEVSSNIKLYIQKLLEIRIRQETPTPSQEEISERVKMSKINSFVASKIKAARRPMKKPKTDE